MRENELWAGDEKREQKQKGRAVMRMNVEAVKGKRERGRPKKRWLNIIE